MSEPEVAGGPDATWDANLAAGRFAIQRCLACREHLFFPRTVCPHCGANRLEWVEASGVGTVYSVTVVRRKPQFGGDYNVVLVDLAEGPRMMSRVEGIAPDAVRIGMAVAARIEKGETGHHLVFAPLGAA